MKEVECRGESLKADAKLLTLTMFRASTGAVLAHLDLFTNNCLTLGEYSSCVMDSGSTRNSRLRILVSDLDEGEDRKYGCNATVLREFGKTDTAVWSIVVRQESM